MKKFDDDNRISLVETGLLETDCVETGLVQTGFKPVSTSSSSSSPPPITQPTKFNGKYRIESARLKHYDYSSNGAYFITICAKNRENFFGEFVNEKLQETERAKICMECLLDLPNHYSNCILDTFMIMPNHVHLIIFIQNYDNFSGIVETGFNVQAGFNVQTGLKPVSTNTKKPKRYSISEIIRGFKTFSARKINYFQNTQGIPFWQSRFYDRIIRNEKELNDIREYIINNPVNWENDNNNVQTGLNVEGGLNVEAGFNVETGFKPVSTTPPPTPTEKKHL